ncbi:MAG: 3'(2'),5'-bisphosphate nucleotidase [Promethearchaeota archaeon]
MRRYSEETKFAVEAVRQATRVTEWFRASAFAVLEKADRTPVTWADLAAQALVLDMLGTAFPDDAVVAEEDATFLDRAAEGALRRCYADLGLDLRGDLASLLRYRGPDRSGGRGSGAGTGGSGGSGTRVWTLDPIDGTKGFRERGTYAVGTCLLVDHVPRVAAISVPRYDGVEHATFVAEAGGGTLSSIGGRGFDPVRVSEREELRGAVLGRSVHHDTSLTDEFCERAGILRTEGMAGMGKFCKLADGSYDLIFHPLRSPRQASWDWAPGTLVLEEAGGLITDFLGQPPRFFEDSCRFGTPGFVASNGLLHAPSLELVSQLIRDEPRPT